MPSIFTNNLTNLNLFPETFLPGGVISPSPIYSFTPLFDGAEYTYAQPLSSSQYHNINPTMTVSGTALSVDGNGNLTGEIQAIGFRSDNLGEIGFITELTINGSDFSDLVLARSNGDATTGDQFLALLANEFNDLTLTNSGNTFHHDGFFSFIDEIDLGGGSDTFVFSNLRIPSVRVDGGTGNDLLDLTAAEAGYTLNMAQGIMTNGTSSLLFKGFENVEGSKFLNDYIGSKKADMIISAGRNDTISSAKGDDTVESGPGKDMVLAGGGHDRVATGKGDDHVEGGSEGDKIWGNSGNDTLMGGDGFDTIRGGGQDDEIYGGNGRDKLYGQGENDKMSGGNSDDLLVGDEGNDTLNGGNANDELMGGDDVDLLKGGNGDDTLMGNSGDDVLFGGAGNDRLFGGTRNDWLKGGVGDDVMNGGSGADKFVFNLGHGSDRIKDFDVTEDTLRLTMDLTDGRSANRIVSKLTEVTDDGVLLSFGDGDTIMLSGLTSTAGLADAIDL